MKRLLLAAALLGPALVAAQTVTPTPGPATVGRMVEVKLSGWNWPTYAPATRFVRTGNTFMIDFEYASDFFGPSRPDFWDLPVPLGELQPGTYTVQARLFDMARPGSQPQSITTPVTVATESHAVRSLPVSPYAQRPFQMIVSSPHYFDPATLRVSVSGDIVRADFDYDPNAPVQEGRVAPPGLVSWAPVNVNGLPAGNYTLYAVGGQRGGGSHWYVTYNALTVRTDTEAIEYYAEQVDRYFVTSTPSEINSLDQPGSAWKRTGQQFRVWDSAGSAPAGALPVCRFFAASHGSHYHTPNAAECQWLRDIEAHDRAQGGTYQGWTYEGIVFYAQVPTNGQCPSGTESVNRSRNGQNRRYTNDSMVYASMAYTSEQEGAVFCSPR